MNEFMFELRKIWPSCSGYFINEQGEIFSTRRSSQPVKLLGNTTASGRYYTLAGVTCSAAEILRNVRTNHKYIEALQKYNEQSVKALIKPSSPVMAMARSHASSLKDGIAARGVIIGTVSGETVSIAQKPVVHTTEQSFKNEMERLAKEHPGTKFVALKILATVEVAGLNWE